MSQSFGIVEEKLLEAEFFLGQLRSSERFSFEARCYFSAFVSSARSVTFALQKTLNGVEGFAEWYEHARGELRADALAPYFVEIRNDVVHKGVNPLNQVTLAHLCEDLARQLHKGNHSHVLVVPSPEAGSGTRIADAIEACHDYCTSLVALIFDCYDRFRTVVDPRWYFTHDNFVSDGRTLDDALAELGFPPGWTSGAPEDENAWRALRRQQPCCQLNGIFREYLGRHISDPDDPVNDSAEA